jgi:hypothetical protein
VLGSLNERQRAGEEIEHGDFQVPLSEFDAPRRLQINHRLAWPWPDFSPGKSPGPWSNVDAAGPPRQNRAMDEKPKRRWFQFRLSTVLILTAILAWAMATRPYCWREYTAYAVSNPAPGQRTAIGAFVSKRRSKGHMAWIRLVQTKTRRPLHGVCVESRLVVNPAAKWPALALFAFLTWKATWALIERRRRRSAAPE